MGTLPRFALGIFSFASWYDISFRHSGCVWGGPQHFHHIGGGNLDIGQFHGVTPHDEGFDTGWGELSLTMIGRCRTTLPFMYFQAWSTNCWSGSLFAQFHRLYTHSMLCSIWNVDITARSRPSSRIFCLVW